MPRPGAAARRPRGSSPRHSHQSELGAAAAEQHVLGHRQFGSDGQFLMHHADAGRPRVARPTRNRMAGPPGTSMRPEISACAPAMIFIVVLLPAPFSPTSPWISPRPQGEIDFGECRDAAERLGDAVHLDQRGMQPVIVLRSYQRNCSPPSRAHSLSARDAGERAMTRLAHRPSSLRSGNGLPSTACRARWPW